MRKKYGKLIINAIILFCANAIFFLTIWLSKMYENVCVDQFLYQIKTSMKGADNSLTGSGFLYMGGFNAILTALEFCAILFFKKIKKFAIPLSVVCVVLSVSFFCFRFSIFTYIKDTNTSSQFFEQNYVKPETVKIKFPENKRNLVFIYAESIENTYASFEDGGHFEQSRIQELTDLAKDNINFSNTEGLGGGYAYNGTSWTVGAMISSTSGVTVKVPVLTNAYARDDDYMSGTVTLGDILNQNGYNQTIIMGSDSEFANRDLYFKSHGNYKILDINSVKQMGKLPNDYKEWWGFEDKKLFEFAKQELISLSNQDKPFNLTLLTADTHSPNGYVCEECEKLFNDQYSNVVNCTSKRINEFVEWLKQQSFYENTTIIIVGDHLTMDPEYMKNVDSDYTRTLYNCIINAPQNPIKQKQRKFATFDLYPTTLASLGVEIEGDRLGLGTNLFSKEETISEKYGVEYSDKELTKKSKYYNDLILK